MKGVHLIAADSIPVPRINSMGFSENPSVTHYGPSVRNQYIIHYVLSGEGVFNGNRVVCGEGFLIEPGMQEHYYPSETEPWGFFWIVSEDPSMAYFFECHRANSETGIFKFHNGYELEAIVKQVRAESERLTSSTRLSELFLRIFHTVVWEEATHKRSVAKTYFEFSVNYIKTNLHLPVSVRDLCDVIGITQPYLYRIFKQEAGCSPKQYITNCKLTRAKQLLASTDLTVSQIADSVGFGGVLDFSKFFSKHLHLSPSAYRNRGGRNLSEQ